MKSKIPNINRLILAIMAMFCSYINASGQLTGIKTIPGTYPTLASAIASINAAGVGAGGVTFNIAAGYTETITGTLSLTATGTLFNPVLFRKNPSTTGANPRITGYTGGAGTPSTATQDGVWRFIGSDYITIDGIDISDNPINTTNPSTMEYGFALYKASTSNGCQSITIKNSVITLNKVNNGNFIGPMTGGSNGIIVMNALASTATTAVTPISGGTNSNNKFYSNKIQNCNIGIALVGYAAISPFSLADNNNDIGGNSTATGNTIINYGGGSGAINAAAAIQTFAQYSLNISHNTINNNNGSGINHPTTLRGIYLNAATSASATISYNTITLNGGGTTQSLSGIENASGSTAAGNLVNISNNTITGGTYATATTGGFLGINNTASPATLLIWSNTISNNSTAAINTGSFYGVLNSGTAATVSINSNIISGNSTGALTTGVFAGIYNTGPVTTLAITSNTIAGNSTSAITGLYYPIYNSGLVTSLISINSNNIGTSLLPAVIFSASNSASHTFINNTQGGAGAALSISNNNFHSVTYTSGGIGSNTYISNGAATFSQAINSNIFTDLAVNTTGSITFISNSVIVSGIGTQNVNNNSISGTFTKTAGGTVTLFTSAASSLSGSQIHNDNNNFSNINVSGITAIAGWVNTDGGASVKTIRNNTFSNWTGGTGSITAMNVSITGPNSVITGNLINTIFSAGSITGLASGAGNDNIYANIIHTLISTGTLATVVNGIAVSAGSTKNVYQNTIYNLVGSNMTTGSVKGIIISGGASANIFQNNIYSLQANALTTGTVNGIWISAGTTITIYRNKIYDISSASAAITTLGGVMGIQVSGSIANATYTLHNNNVGDLRTPSANTGESIRGLSLISSGPTSTTNVYYNTIYIAASSTGATFGSSGIYHAAISTSTTASLNLRNNIITNTSVPSGAAFTVAYRRSGITLANYAATSNSNLFYGGLPSANRLIFYDGTNSDQFLSSYKTRVAARDAASVTEDLITTSRFLSTSGSAATFLHIDPSKSTQAESGAVNISGYPTDIDVEPRHGNAGYAGTGASPDIGSDEFEGSGYVLSGTYNVGVGQVYTSLTKAGGLFAAINSIGLSGDLIVRITSDLSEDGSNALYQWNENGAGNYKLIIKPDGPTLRTISGSALSGLIRLNGADRVTIDGSNGGSTNYLTFRNTNTAGSTGTGFTFINGATNDAVQYCNIEAYANATNGVILFGASSVTGGNSNITISNCAINATVSSNTSNVAVYSAGTPTAGYQNATNTVLNNTIFDYRDRGLDITSSGSDAWIISGNSFYNGDVTGSINYAAAATLHGIRISGGSGYTVFKNYIGGNAPLAAGTNAIYSSTLGVISYLGILVTTTSAIPITQIEGNRITKISVFSVPTSSTSAANIFVGIESNGSGISIGDVIAGDGNTIGSNSDNGSIMVTTTTSSSTYKSNIRGINFNSTGGIIYGNQVGGIDIKNTGTSAAPSIFQGIAINSATAPSQVSSNLIGSNGAGAASNSIRVVSGSTSTGTALTGIAIASTVTSTVQVSGNMIQNMSHMVTAASAVTGISNAATGTADVIISNDTVSNNSTVASSGSIMGIFNSGNPLTLTINNNIISGNSSTASGTGTFYGIITSGAPPSITVNSNTVSGNTMGTSTGLFASIYNNAVSESLTINSNILFDNATASITGLYYPIVNTAAVTASININGNSIGTAASNAVTFNGVAANSGSQLLITNNGGGSSTALSISNNNFQGIIYAPFAGTGGITFISNSIATNSQSIIGNTFTNLNVNTSGNVTFISNSVIVPAGGIQNINNNAIVTGFTKRAAGTVTLFTSVASSASGSIIKNNNNDFSNITVTGTTIIAGWVNTDAGATNKTIQNNTFRNWAAGTGSVTAMSVNLSCTNAITSNTIKNISGGGAVTGIATGAGNDNIYFNTISTLVSSFAAPVTGISVSAGTTKNIYKNKVYDLSNSSATGTVNGILISGGGAVNIFNNLIGDLRAPAASANDAIRGISATSTTVFSNINVYYNSIYLNASSSGTNFGSSGFFHTANATATTAMLNLRNNIIVNASVSNGTGLTVAYRRSSTALGNYAGASNNNLFYAGIPAANRLIFYDGSNADQTLTPYKTRVATRDAASVSENLTAKFLDISGASPVFLHMNTTLSSLIESGAENIAGYTDDFDGQIRAGNPGYTGSSSSPDIGADEIFGLETTPPVITYALLGDVTTTVNREVTGITITDASGINNTPGSLPRIYFKRLSDPNVWIDNDPKSQGWSFTEATNSSSPYNFIIDYSLLYGGSAGVSGIIQYFFVAQDIATTNNVAIESGAFASTPASVELTSAAFPISGAINSYSHPFNGTYNVGPGEIYTSLTKSDGIFGAINSAGLGGNVIVNIMSDLNEDGTNALNQWSESGLGNYTLTIKPNGVVPRTISGNVAGGLIRFNGADRVKIDGYGGDDINNLIFSNTNTAGTIGSAFLFTNGATKDTLRNCRFEAFTNSTNGVIHFGTSLVNGGNSNNLIESCNINATIGANTGDVGIYSAGTATSGYENSGNKILNNNIFAYYYGGIDLTATGSSAWTISGNSFFNGEISGSIDYPASSSLYGIRILGGSGYSILNNYIGGDERLAVGPNALYNSTTGTLSFAGIALTTTNSTPASFIKGNHVSAITISAVPTTANALLFTGIATGGSGINTGGNNAADGNIIGSGAAIDRIIITTSTLSAANTSGIYGINCTSSGGIINNNQISGFDISNIGGVPAASAFYGIYVDNVSPPAQINNNLIGGIASANSIQVVPGSASSSIYLTGIGIGPAVNSPVTINANRVENISNLSTTSSGFFTGINNMATLGGANITIANDTIQYISSGINANAGATIYTGIASSSTCTINNNLINNLILSSTGINAQVAGIKVSGAYASTVSGNIISNLSTASNKETANAETGTPVGSAIIGILNSTIADDQTINNNRLSGFTATSGAANNVVITGIGITSTGSGNIFNNRFGTFTNIATGPAPAIRHIMAAAGSFNAYNNSLRISNLAYTNGIKIYGIVHASASSWNYFNNSVRVSGNSNGTALRSAAFLLSANSAPVLNNNIFFNIRTGNGFNYSVSNLGSPPSNWPATASDYNNLFAINTNTTAEWGPAADKTFAQWQSLTAGDVHSISSPVSFLVSTYDLEPDSITNCGLDNSGTPITTPVNIDTDINNTVRNPANPDMGAYEFSYLPFIISSGNNSPVCLGSMVNLTADPGIAVEPTFTWTNPADSIISVIQAPAVAAMAGQYVITVKDSTGCTVTDSTLVLLNLRPTANITGSAIICEGGSAILSISVTGTGVISGTLSNNDVFSGTAPMITVSVSPDVTTVYTIIELSDESCTSIPADITDSAIISLTHAGGWLATVDSNWNNPANWCGGLTPTITTNVIIPGNGVQPVIGAAGAVCNNLTISNGAILTITGTNSLTVGGNLENAGSLIANNSTVIFNAPTGIQNLNGGSSAFYNISHTGAGVLQLATNSLTTNGFFSNGPDAGDFDAFSNALGQTVTGAATLSNSNYLAGAASNIFNGGLIISGGVFTGNEGNVTTTDLTINSGGLIAPSGTFFVTGAWVHNGGTFTAGANTVIFNGSAVQAISGSDETVFNNFTVAASSGIISGNITINGILNLQAHNPSASKGALDMGNNTLNMGATATTVGQGDVTGIVRRTTMLPDIEYTFGNQFTSATFQNVGAIPGELSFKIDIGNAPAWKTDAINRVYDIAFKRGTDFHGTARFHYQDDELNGNTPVNQLVIYRYLFAASFVIESGRSNFSSTNNWVELSNLLGAGADSSNFGVLEWTLGTQSTLSKEWNGSSNTDWTNPLNWNGGVPGLSDNVIIPDAGTTDFDPELPDSASINSLNIDSAGILSGGTGKLFLTGADGAWLANGQFNYDASTVIFQNALATMAGKTDFHNITIDSGASLTMSSGQHMRIFGAVTNNGTWNVSFVENIVEYSAGNQIVINPNGGSGGYSTLVLDKPGIKTMPNTPMNIQRDLRIEDSAFVTAAAPLIVGGKIYVEAHAAFNAGIFDHSLKGDWDNSGTFIPGVNSILFNGDATQTIKGNSVTDFNNLTVIGAGVLLDQDVTIGTTLNLTTGNFDVGTKTLTMSATANPISGSPFSLTNMIIADGGGMIRKAATSSAQASYLFPVGAKMDSTAYAYSPVTLAFNGGSYAGYAGVKVKDAKHPANANTANYLTRYWTISQSGYTDFSSTVVANYADSEAITDVVGAEASILMAQWNGAKPWHLYASSVNTANNSLTATEVTSFGDFSGINNAGPVIISIGAGPSTVVCANTALTLIVNATGDSTLTYLWSHGLGTGISATPSTDSAGSTLYTVTVTDGNGFTATASINITVNSLPSITTAPTASSICFSSNAQTAELTYSAASNAPTRYSITWDIAAIAAGFENVLNDSLPAGAIIIAAPPGVQPSTYTATIRVSNASSCQSSSSSFALLVNPLPAVIIDSSAQSVCFSTNAQTTTLSYSLPSNIPVTYTLAWDPTATAAGFIPVNNELLPTGLINISVPANAPASDYTGTITVSNENGCTGIATVFTVTINSKPDVSNLSISATDICLGDSPAIAVVSSSLSDGTFILTYDLSGDNNTTGDTISLSMAGGFGTFTIPDILNAGYTTLTVTSISNVGNCANTSVTGNTAGITIRKMGTWLGIVSTDWFDDDNWCGGVPTSADITIGSGLLYYPVINTGTASVNDITISAGGSLTISAASLQIKGDIINNGALTATDGYIEMDGSDAQTIAAGTFAGNTLKGLVINNSAGITLGGALFLSDVLTISEGSLHTGGHLTLISTATTTARVAAITSHAITPITGNVTVQQYFGGKRKYRLVTSSVTTKDATSLLAGEEDFSIWGNWQNRGINTDANLGTFITGGASADGFDTQTPNASLFTYDDVNRLYTGYTTAKGKNTKYSPLKAGVAYYMFIYGDRRNTITTSSPNPTVLTAKGSLLTGDQAYTTNSLIPISGVTGRYTMIGNPFASPVDWTTIPRSGITDTYWGWDPNLSSTGGYVTVSTVGDVIVRSPYSGTVTLDQYIQPGQGFFVKTSGALPMMTIREQDKTGNVNSNASRRQRGSWPLIAINLQYNNGASKVLADGAVAVFDNIFSNQVRPEDASKMFNTEEGLAIFNTDQLLSIEARKPPQNNDTIFLNVSRLSKTQYTLQVFTYGMEGSVIRPYLQDRYLNTVQPLLLNDTNSIDFKVNAAIPASSNTNRFQIIFKSDAVLSVKFIKVKATAKAKNILVEWDVAEEIGITQYDIEHSEDGVNFDKIRQVTSNGNNNYDWLDSQPAEGNNYYRIRAIEASGNYSLSNMVVVKIQMTASVLRVNPNPIQNSKINFNIKITEKGNYTVTVFDYRARAIFKQDIEHTGGALNRTVKINKVTPGVYYLEVKNKSKRYIHEIIIE